MSFKSDVADSPSRTMWTSKIGILRNGIVQRVIPLTVSRIASSLADVALNLFVDESESIYLTSSSAVLIILVTV